MLTAIEPRQCNRWRDLEFFERGRINEVRPALGKRAQATPVGAYPSAYHARTPLNASCELLCCESLRNEPSGIVDGRHDSCTRESLVNRELNRCANSGLQSRKISRMQAAIHKSPPFPSIC